MAYGLQKEDEGFLQNERKYETGRGFHRYDNALKNLIPIRGRAKKKETAPIDDAGLLSIIFFSWLSKIMYKAYRKGITMEELPALSPYDAGSLNAKRLELLWEEELADKGPERASLTRVAWRFCGTRIFATCLAYSGSLLSGFLAYTYLMRRLLEHVQSGNGSYEEGAKWALLLIATELARTLFLNWSWGVNQRTASRLRSGCLTLLYKKIIRVDYLGNKNIGKAINMFTNDAQKIFEAMNIGPMIVGAPISTVIGIFYVLWLLGPMALLGMLAFLLFLFVQYLMSRLLGYFHNKAVKISDTRVRLMNEILDCIKLIKMYAWEKRFSEDLLGVRKTEQRLLLRASTTEGFSASLAPAMPVISSNITFLAHLSGGNNLTAAMVFPYTTLLDSGIQLSLFFFQEAIRTLILLNISMRRLKSLLLLPDGNCSVTPPILKSQAVAITNGTFACSTFDDQSEKSSQEKEKNGNDAAGNAEEKDDEEELNKPTDNLTNVEILFDVSFEAEKGKLVGICGQVGSGKSSLLLAALGQLRVSEGQVMRDGSCAYVSQQAWINNAGLRENILFGDKYDHSRYQKAVHACSLSQDIGMMPGGDQTEIGEQGVNLSGGQKQRVALARALYADRDIYFLDDPLSAVDAKVGSYLFDNLILGALRGKTVLFVTHQIQYLNRCDDIYMMRDGRIIEHGTHDELMKLGNEYASMVAAISADRKSEDESMEVEEIETLTESVGDHSITEAIRGRAASASSHVSARSAKELNTADTQLTVAEDLQQGAVKAHTYHSYIVAAGGYFPCLFVLLTFIVNVASITFSSWWLAEWINAGGGNATIVRGNLTIPSDNLNDNPHFGYFQNIYGGTIGVILLTGAIRSLVYTKATIVASTNMHNLLFKKIIFSPMRFFDTTPTGRIQHLFSRDVDEVDNKLPFSLSRTLGNVIIVVFSMLGVCLVLPWIILPLCVVAAVYYVISKIFRVAIRDLKRMENKARAPVISFVTATVQGLSTIHAFGKERNFVARFIELFDENNKGLFMCWAAMRWLAVRNDVLSVAITGFTALLIVVLQNQVPAALAGLALSYSARMSEFFRYTFRLASDTEIQFISVERINHYIRTLKKEGCANQPDVEPPSTWPSAAVIKFKNVSMAYGEGAPIVLKNISISIEAAEKIGIVGRTGSGKSSLTVALFRLVELAEGKIEIDDVDISEISLEQLRTKLSIIPQDPVLFSGTIRSNLDPFKLYTDAEVWRALEKTELKGRVQSLTGHLDAVVGFGGDTFSVGERQLLCLSRALLRNSKILVLDEATAAVDPETEVAVQDTVQREFPHCTILTIAHRLQTVLPLNRILVMDGGKVLEFDTPSNLLNDQSSEFSKMMAAAEQAEGH